MGAPVMHCTICSKNAQKSNGRWVIVHRCFCSLWDVEPTDIGPVTALNDPDNVAFIIVSAG